MYIVHNNILGHRIVYTVGSDDLQLTPNGLVFILCFSFTYSHDGGSKLIESFVENMF